MRGTIQNNANAPQDDDIVMKNGPDDTESDPEIHESHVPQNKRRSLRLSGDASQKPSPIKKVILFLYSQCHEDTNVDI